MSSVAPIFVPFAFVQPMEAGDANCILIAGEDYQDAPPRSWFVKKLTGNGGQPPTRWLDSYPVFYIAAPKAVVLELIGCATNRQRALRSMEQVPPSLEPMALPTWSEYMERFGVAVLDKTPLPAGPPPKRRRLLPPWFPTAEEAKNTPEDVYLINAEGGCVEREAAYMLCQMETEREERWTTLELPSRAMADILVPDLRELGYTMKESARSLPSKVLYELSWPGISQSSADEEEAEEESESSSSSSSSSSSESEPKIC